MIRDDLKLLDDSGKVPKPNGVVGGWWLTDYRP